MNFDFHLDIGLDRDRGKVNQHGRWSIAVFEPLKWLVTDSTTQGVNDKCCVQVNMLGPYNTV